MKDFIIAILIVATPLALTACIIPIIQVWKSLRRNKHTKFVLGQKVYFTCQHKINSGVVQVITTDEHLLQARKETYKLNNLPEIEHFNLYENKQELIKSL